MATHAPSTPDAAATGTLTVTNTGRAVSPASDLTVAAPDGWTVTPESTHLAPMAGGAEKPVPLRITPPRDVEPGSYELAVTVRTGRMTTTTTVPVEVNLPNLALDRPATQQSTAWSAPASRAVDGNTDGNFGAGSVTHTAEPSSEAWWQVDLGAVAGVSGVEVWNRTDCCADRLSDFWVLASNDPITADALAEARATPGVTAVHVSGQAGTPSVVRLPEGTTARHVRVQLASPTDPLSLAEVQVRGTAGG